MASELFKGDRNKGELQTRTRAGRSLTNRVYLSGAGPLAGPTDATSIGRPHHLSHTYSGRVRCDRRLIVISMCNSSRSTTKPSSDMVSYKCSSDHSVTRRAPRSKG